MKKSFYAMLAALTIGSSLTACSNSEDKAEDKPKEKTHVAASTAEAPTTDHEDGEKATPEEIAQIERMDKGILLYGEGNKGGDYSSTVENAGYRVQTEGKDTVGIITARVTIQNVREDNQTVDLSEIDFSVQDEKTGKSYDGQAMPFDEDKFKTVPAGYSLTFDVSFMIKNPPKNVDNFYLYMNSSVDPYEDIHWQLNNLIDSKN
ncbi:hypothetical protein [Priestia megaterium]|uniref:hypothetical protein n=1 Tax=Priestia megaterium TaxID=1404 RepID=UPI00387365EC|nr:hypothetical protein QY062_24565 [Priestia megaterium]